MKLLLDTHALVWFVDQDQLLSPAAHAAISDVSHELLVSAGTIWEIAIKVGLGKLRLSLSYREWLSRAITDLGAAILPITIDYADAQSSLPQLHRDPFDRLLAAQARLENAAIVSADEIFDKYGVARVW